MPHAPFIAPSPEMYEDWKPWARFLLRALDSQFLQPDAELLVATAEDDDTTPSVALVAVLITGDNSNPTAITQLDKAVPGQTVRIINTGTTNASTIADGGNFKLLTAWAPTADDVLVLTTTNGTTWYEETRSAN